ncbi:MAG: hypothetical protein ABI780_05230, partial [Ardenticatenales bacterium]
MLLARLCAAWLVGIAVADVLWPPIAPPPPGNGAVLLGVLLLAVLSAIVTPRIAARHRGLHWLPRVMTLTLVAVLAAGRVWLARPRFDAAHVASMCDRGTVTIEGVIGAEPERRDGGVHYRL